MTVFPQTMLEYISTRDHRVMRRLNNWRAPRWVRLWMLFATRGGDGWLWYAISLAMSSVRGPERGAALMTAGTAAATGAVVFLVMKRQGKAKAAVRNSRALLGNTAAARSVLFPFGSLDHGVCVCGIFQFVLSWLAARAAVLRFQCCSLTGGPGYAFFERCCRRRPARNSARVHGIYPRQLASRSGACSTAQATQIIHRGLETASAR